MAHKQKGQLTVTSEWAKHLRKFWRRQFWKGERYAERKLLRKALDTKNSRQQAVCRNLGLTNIFSTSLSCLSSVIGRTVY